MKVTKTSRNIDIWMLKVALVFVFVLGILVDFYSIYRGSLIASNIRAGKSAYFIAHLSYHLPAYIVWAVAARGALRLKSYTRSVVGSPDGVAFDYIANALLLVVIYTILSTLAGGVKLLFVGTPYLRSATVMVNYLPLLIMLAASIYYLIGSKNLSHVVSLELIYTRSKSLKYILFAFIIIITGYSMYFYQLAPGRLDDDGTPHFAYSLKIMLISYVLPYIVCWLLGLIGSLNLAYFARKVEGSIYKVLLRDLYAGILVVFATTYVLQVLFILNISGSKINPGLLLVFGMLIIGLAGWLLVYRGANQLSKLEE